MAETQMLERTSGCAMLEPSRGLASRDAEARETGFDQIAGENEAAPVGFDQRVRQVGMHDQGLIGGDGPWRRRPDDRTRRTFRQVVATEGPGKSVAVARIDLQGYVDRDVGAVLVFHLGLGQRGLAVETPVDRL